MKEYICKEDIKENFYNDLEHMYGWGWSLFDISKTIDSTLTITKADICREFIEYVKFCDKTYVKPQVMRHPEYYKGYKDAFRFFEQILSENELEQLLLEREEE